MVELSGQAQVARLQLTADTLHIQRQELVYTHSATDHIDPSILARVRHNINRYCHFHSGSGLAILIITLVILVVVGFFWIYSAI